VVLAVVVAASTATCGGSSKFLEDEDWSREQAPDGGAWREDPSLDAPDQSASPKLMRHLDGVRLELSMAPKAQPTARCACLDVAVGAPSDAMFQWETEAPDVSAAQMAIAIRGEGARCPDGSTLPVGRRPSIRAVDRVGGDVIVVVEELREGRPLALGAVTTMPDPGGSVYVRSDNRALPYGAPAGSRELCKIYTRAGTGTIRAQ
jgi:hypothetical protein